MMHTIMQAVEIAKTAGFMAVVLDVLRDAAFDRRLEFYHGLGFRPMADPENPDRVFLPMKDIRATLGG